MRLRYQTVIICCTVSALLTACGQPPTQTQQPPTTHTPTSTTTTTTTTTIKPAAPTTTTTIHPAAHCPQWWPQLRNTGLPEHDLTRWDYIIWRESRCQPDAHNGEDPNSGSRGLTQINGFWCRPSQYHPDGWLQAQGVLQHCDELYDPVTNLLAAYNVWRYAQDRGCGWSPWTTRNTRWC